jgi:hypothetical protein
VANAATATSRRRTLRTTDTRLCAMPMTKGAPKRILGHAMAYDGGCPVQMQRDISGGRKVNRVNQKCARCSLSRLGVFAT